MNPKAVEFYFHEFEDYHSEKITAIWGALMVSYQNENRNETVTFAYSLIKLLSAFTDYPILDFIKELEEETQKRLKDSTMDEFSVYSLGVYHNLIDYLIALFKEFNGQYASYILDCPGENSKIDWDGYLGDF